MAPEIQEYYSYLLGGVPVPPGPIELPDGISAVALARIIHETLVRKATVLEDVQHVQILYSAWAILNDSYIPISACPASTQTDPGIASLFLDSSTQTPGSALFTACDRAVQTAEPPPLRSLGSQTALVPDGPETRDDSSQTDGRSAPACCEELAVQTEPAAHHADASSTAVQTDAKKLRTKWTQMRRRLLRTTGSQTDRSPSPPPPPAPPAVESRPAEAQTEPATCRTTETQTLLPQAVPGRRAAATQTSRLRPPWVVRLVRGAPPPPAERPPEARRFHGRLLLRRGQDVPPPEIPLTAAPAPALASASAGSPSAPKPPTDPRLISGSEPRRRPGRRRTRVESDSTGSIASPVGQGGRRSRSPSSGGENDLPTSTTGPEPTPTRGDLIPVPAPDPGSVLASILPLAPAPAPIPAPVSVPASIPPPAPIPFPVPAPASVPVRVPAPVTVPTRDPRLWAPACELTNTAPRPVGSSAWRTSSPLNFLARLPAEEPGDQKVSLSLDKDITAVLDTCHSFLLAPPPELIGDSGAVSRPAASAAMRMVDEGSGSDMDLDDD